MVKSVSLWLKGEFDVIQAPISLPHTAGIVFFLPFFIRRVWVIFCKKVLKRYYKNIKMLL